MRDLERGPSSDGESAICATSLNNSSSTLVERLDDVAGLSDRQIELYDTLAKLNRGDHWLFFTNAGFSMEDARALHARGLINATRQMGIPAAQLKRNEQTLPEKLMTLHAEALDELNLPPETDTVHKQAATLISELQAENERLGRERDNAYTMSRLQTARRLAAESALSRHPSFNDAIEAAAKVVESPQFSNVTRISVTKGPEWTDETGMAELVNSHTRRVAVAVRSLKLPDYRGGE